MVRALDLDRRVVGLICGRCIVGNNLGQVVHTNVPLFTKEYNLVPCEGLYA